MPRRKNVRVARRSCSDPDASILADGTNEKQLKKEAFIRDFDIQVSRRIKDMETAMNTVVDEIGRMFTSQKCKIKKNIRQMTLAEFIEKGGDLEALDFTAITNELIGDKFPPSDEIKNTAEISFTVPAEETMRRTLRKRGPTINSYAPEARAPKTTRAKRKGKENNFTTPHIGNKTDYPLVTPKFDTRKPLTMAREPKKGETLVSLDGSPVMQVSANHDSSSDNVLSLLLSKQQTLLASNLSDLTISPNSLMASKERLEEALGAINSRIEDLAKSGAVSE